MVPGIIVVMVAVAAPVAMAVRVVATTLPALIPMPGFLMASAPSMAAFVFPSIGQCGCSREEQAGRQSSNQEFHGASLLE
jgi:hypothetical protein